MKTEGNKFLGLGMVFTVAFIIWTLLVQKVDVQAVGQGGTDVGFATFNCCFHKFTGVHLLIYHITDWLGLIPLLVCMIFGGIGFKQWIQRKSLLRVDYDIIFLGVYYIVVAVLTCKAMEMIS